MIAWLAVLGSALAAPLADAHWFGALGDEAPGLGVGLGIAAPVGPVHLEGSADLGAIGPIGFEAHAWASLRWFFVGTDSLFAPSLRVGPGLRVAERSAAPEALVGAALDLPRLGPARLRLGVDGIGRLGGPITGRLTLALVAGVPTRRERPAPTPTEPAFDDPTGQASVWLPHPFCRWVPASEVDPWLAMLPPGQALRVRAPGYVPVEASASDLGEVTLQPAPEHGSVIVVASPGDRVRLGPDEFVAPDDGVVVLDLPVGIVDLEVVGGGRTEVLEAAVADGYVAWLRPAPPGPLRLTFALGKSTLDDAARAWVAGIVASAGGASFAVQGSASPDGVPADNLRLADQRGKTVAEALIASGLPPSRVRLLPAQGGDPALPLDVQRAVIVTPIPPGAP